jgi:hypothetical protein
MPSGLRLLTHADPFPALPSEPTRSKAIQREQDLKLSTLARAERRADAVILHRVELVR